MKTRAHMMSGLASALALVAMSCHGTTHATNPVASSRCGTPCDISKSVVFDTEDDIFAWAFTEPELEGEQAVTVSEPRAETTVDQRPGRVEVRELFTARSIVNRAPMGIGLHFKSDRQKVWAYTKVQNRNAPSHVSMEWRRNGVHRKTVDVPVGRSDSWRTWSSHRMVPGDEGSWTVEVRDPNGRVLDRTEFEVDAPARNTVPTASVR